ncbi:MAG: gluconate 2-dehydrogenase subunit 3 family protein [Gemmatimonadaceae bacterium]
MTVTVLEPVRATFRAVAAAVVPETEALQSDEWSTLEQLVEHALAKRPERLRRQFVTLLRVIEYLPALSHRRRFSRLGPGARVAVLKKLERSPILLVRRGFWGLRTLVMMGYYAQPEIQTRLGYCAHPDGWSARRRSGEYPVIDLPPDERGPPDDTGPMRGAS